MIKGIDKKIRNKRELALIASFASTFGIIRITGLKAKIGEEISKSREFLATNRQYSTINRKRREETRKLEYLENLKRIADKL
ncbi:hypothetical protein HZB88_02440 [archaeon]|nr:hypothetical protein [archaeon]